MFLRRRLLTSAPTNATALRLMGRAEPPFRQTPAATGFAAGFASKFMLGGGDKSRLPVEDDRRIEPTPDHDE